RRRADGSVIAREAFVGRQVLAAPETVALRRRAGARRAGACRAERRVRACNGAARCERPVTGAVVALLGIGAGAYESVAARGVLAVADARIRIVHVAVVALLARE